MMRPTPQVSPTLVQVLHSGGKRKTVVFSAFRDEMPRRSRIYFKLAITALTICVF